MTKSANNLNFHQGTSNVAQALFIPIHGPTRGFRLNAHSVVKLSLNLGEKR